MNNNYNLLMTRRINMIKPELNEEYIRKFNLNIDTIKREKKRKLSIKELDELENIIKDLKRIPKDEKFQDYVLRHLKVFLIYGNVKLIDERNIVLNLSTDNENSLLHIEINKDHVTSTLRGKYYKEEATWKKLDSDYYTTYKRKETNIYNNRNKRFYEIYKTNEFHGFHNNKEIATRLITEQDNYIKDTITEEISRKGLGTDNYKDIINYYRQDGFIIRKQQRKYKEKSIGELLNYKQYQISEDYHNDEKYLNKIGLYKKLDRKWYNEIIKGNCKIKTIYKQG